MSKVMPTKDPDEILDYSIDWTNKLQSSENISTSTWTVETTGITKVSDTSSSKISTAWLSGGVDDVTYTLKNTIVTNSTPQRTFVDRIIVPVKVV